jgi:tetratricopeptide (TPR) repeat protein
MSEPPGRDAAEHRADSLNILGRHDQALGVVGPALAADPHDVGLLVQAAIAQAGLHRLDEALRLLYSAAAADPGSSRVHRIISFVALERGLVDQAVQAAYRATQLSPFDPYAHAQLARACARQGNRDYAMMAASRAIELAPDLADSHLAMSDVRFPDGAKPAKADLKVAETHLLRALQIEPGNAAALNDLARVHLALGHQVKAAGHLASAVRADPMTPVMQQNMDVVFIGLIARAHWVLFVMWFVSRQVSRAEGEEAPRWVPLVLAVAGFGLIGWVLWRLRAQVPHHLPAFVRGFTRRQRLGSVWAVCLLVTAVLFLASALAPSSISGALLLWAWLPLMAGAVLSWVRYARERRAAR